MIPWETLSEARIPGGGVLTLRRRGQDYTIRSDGEELMSSWSHGSEESLARLACQPFAHSTDARVLVGGLGMGYTLRAVLDMLGTATAQVVVAEIVPEVVDWNRGPLAGLAGAPLMDPRVSVAIGDVEDQMRQRAAWDVILLDVDNGPTAFTREQNEDLYDREGLALCRTALRPGGTLAVWSAYPDREFERRLKKAGFKCKTVRVLARTGRGRKKHTVFLGRARL